MRARRLRKLVYRIVYDFTQYRLSDDGILEFRERGEWKPARETKSLRDLIGEESYEKYKESRRGLSWEIGQMREWADKVGSYLFASISLCLAVLGYAGGLLFPYSAIAGLLASVISFILIFLKRKRARPRL